MQLGDIEVQILSDGMFRLDGGAMYGAVPRPLWERVSPPDERNRILMDLHCTLIKTAGARILVDTGIGANVNEKDAERWGLQRSTTLQAQLKAQGVEPEDITHVVFTHLHFDHVGGAGRDSTVSFPKASYVIQKREWDSAHSSHPKAKASYPAPYLSPLESGARLLLVEGESEIVPGVRVLPTGGHTWGHQVVLAESGDQGVLCWGDLMPLSPYVRPLWVCGYDVDPEGSVSQKILLAERAVRHDWRIVTSHDPHIKIGRLERNKDSYRLVDAQVA